MSRTSAGFACLLFSLMLATAGCGKQAAQPEPTVPPPAESAQPAAAATETPPADQAAAAQDDAAAAPAENISETGDSGQETVTDAPRSTTQPSLRLGAAPAGPPVSSQFKEGTHYVKVVPAQPTSVAPGKVEVIEVFWYGCGHCFALDPGLESWRSKSKPPYVDFVRIPAMWNEATRMHARVFYTADVLGKLDALHSDIFREIHINGDPLNTSEKISSFFVAHGVSADEFQKAFSSFAVENKLQRADFLNRRYRIDSVPTVIVNGKYRTDVGMAGGEEQLFALINELAAAEHGD